jgi:hypothetical protein
MIVPCIAPELVVEGREHRPAGHARLAEAGFRSAGARGREGQLPAHQHHQAEAEEQEQQPGDTVLDPIVLWSVEKT